MTRILLAAALLLLALANPAAAMGGHKGAGNQPENDANKAAAAKKAKEADRAYHEALKKIPDKPQDPWGQLR